MSGPRVTGGDCGLAFLDSPAGEQLQRQVTSKKTTAGASPVQHLSEGEDQ